MSDDSSRLLGGLEVLSAVASAGSFVAAGRALGLTASGVSRAVARLEAHLGVRLFDRNARVVLLTDEGRRFLAAVVPHLGAIADAARDLGGGARVRGRLRVNVDAWFARVVLAPHLGRFLARFPEVTLDLVVRDRVGDLVGEGFDLAIRSGTRSAPSLIRKKLLETRILTCAAPSYLARHGRPAHPRDLARHHCILFRDPTTDRPFGWELRRGKQRIDIPAAGRLVVNDPSLLVAACAAGHGIAQMYALGVRPYLADGTLVDLFPDWSDERFPLYVFHRSRHLPSARLRAFIDFVASIDEGR
jgi:DNA-binding transcriptional LysR family regulator